MTSLLTALFLLSQSAFGQCGPNSQHRWNAANAEWDCMVYPDTCSNCIGPGNISDGLGVSEIDESVIQRRVSASCPAGQSIRLVAQDGSVTCETDDTGAGATTAKLTADKPLYGTGFADVGLSFSLAANTTYYFKFDVVFQSTATTTGIKFAVNGPANPVVLAVQTQIPISLVATTEGGARAYDSGTATASVDTINVNLHAEIKGIIATAGAGTLALRGAAEVSGGKVLIRAGSTGVLETR